MLRMKCCTRVFSYAGLQSRGLIVNANTSFSIETVGAGSGPAAVGMFDPVGNPVPVRLSLTASAWFVVNVPVPLN